MKLTISFFLRFALGSLLVGLLQAQNEPIVLQAESGALGADFRVVDQSGVQYVTIVGTASGQNPVSVNRVISYSVTFPAAGTYELYARVRVGPDAFNDDSFYYGNGFGAKSPTNDNDWITVNGLSPVGFSGPTDIVSGAGTASNGVWKWIKLSEFNGGETPIRFTVAAGALTQIFQIGAREDGLDLDALVFAKTGLFFTVANLDHGEPGSSTPPPPPFTPTGPPIGTGKSKFLGNVYSSSQVVNLTKYWNQVTPENAGKWGTVEATRNMMNWSELDAAYQLAKTNGFPFMMHVLVWGNQQPAWIETLPPTEQLAEIEQWFAAVAARYPQIDLLEVVNEPLHDPPDHAGDGGGNYLAALGGGGSTGWDWVLNSFRLARLYFPNTKLMINDFGVTASSADAQRYAEVIRLLQADDLIDAIGIEGHAFETRVPASTTADNLNFLAALGLPIYITELDIDGPTDTIQLQDYQRLFPLFWEHPAVRGITLWGYRPGMWRTDQGAYLALGNGAERAAMLWLQNYIKTAQRPQLRVYINSSPSEVNIPLNVPVQIMGLAADADGDMTDHWLEIRNPAGQWSWEGWLTGEPWEGALGGDGSFSRKEGMITFTRAGVYTVRATALDSARVWSISPEVSIRAGLSARPTVSLTVDQRGGDLDIPLGTTVSVAAQATDPDGDMAAHWLEIANPVGIWNWEGWLIEEPWAGALGGDGSASQKNATHTFTAPGDYQLRSTATDATNDWSISNIIWVHVH